MQDNKRFFIEENSINDGTALIIGDEFFHLSKVLRGKVGDEIIISANDGIDRYAVIKEIGKQNAVAEITHSKKNFCEPVTKVTLFQALPKGDKIDLIVQKAVELGVSEIRTFTSQFTVVKDNASKTQRLNKIALEACKQCGRGNKVQVLDTLSFNQIIKQLGGFDAVIFAFEGEKQSNIKTVLSSMAMPQNIAVIIGSEGGFSENEAKTLAESGAKVVSLGNRILRAETASIAVLSVVMYEFNEFCLKDKD